jgi:hypothetical protein
MKKSGLACALASGLLALALAAPSAYAQDSLVIEVPVDIKPQSCPNPLNVKSRGVLPVAILGTADLDVRQIDVASIALEGVSPIRSGYEDVATPFEPFVGKEYAFDCTTEGPDGELDLTLKFEIQELVAANGEVSDGDVLVLQLTGNLQEEYGGTPIYGEDVVVVLIKGKKACGLGFELALLLPPLVWLRRHRHGRA